MYYPLHMPDTCHYAETRN